MLNNNNILNAWHHFSEKLLYFFQSPMQQKCRGSCQLFLTIFFCAGWLKFGPWEAWIKGRTLYIEAVILFCNASVPYNIQYEGSLSTRWFRNLLEHGRRQTVSLVNNGLHFYGGSLPLGFWPRKQFLSSIPLVVFATSRSVSIVGNPV